MYEPLGAGAHLTSTRTQAWASIVAIWSVVTVAGYFAAKAGAHADAWRRAVAGTLAAAQQLQRELSTIGRLSWVCTGVSAVALVLWTHGVLRNGIARGVRGVGRAEALYWLLPLFGIRLAITPLRHVVSSVGYSEHRLGRWLWVAYIHLFVMFFTTLGIMRSAVTATTVASTLDALDTQAQILWAVTVWMVGSATIATLAIRHTDRAVSSI